MSKVNAAATHPLVNSWLRQQMQVRCGLASDRPSSVRVYLHTGMQVARRGLRPALGVHQRMLKTLLAASEDEALPWFWRSVCLEHVNLPLAQVTSLLSAHDPLALRAVEAAVQIARDRLPALPNRC